ncbi:hypothetical protein MLD38_034958 [Melastoma candidum]|uniref:Uncharacterized protein n=1 Tax=Melastoma candidum TaxID=119954 RepID=A0ACB9MC48_9MYRT|nr:hypothetical protein MLD38_034958 [Melastoma candidum]
MNYENYDPTFPDQPVVDLYLPIWAKLPAFRFKPAFIWVEDDSATGRRSELTYSDLNRSAEFISQKLVRGGLLKRRETVVVLSPPGLQLVEIIFGCQRAGLVAVPVMPPHPSFGDERSHHHLVRVMSQTKPKAAIASPDYIGKVKQYVSLNENRLSHLMRSLVWVSVEELIARALVDDVDDDGHSRHLTSSDSYGGCKPDEVYLIQYTSGATGIPKPVLVTAGSVAHNARAARKSYDLHPSSMIASWLPQYHDCGLVFLLLTVVSGATCVLASPNSFLRRPRLWLEMITEFRATCTPVPSFTLPLVVKRGDVSNSRSVINLWSMKNLIIINEPIHSEPVEEFVKIFSNFGLDPSSISPSYGLAENCTFVSTAWRANNHRESFPCYNKLLPSAKLGSTTADEENEEETRIIVVDEESGELVKDGIEGEIWVSSPSNALGYLGNPNMTREIFYARPKEGIIGRGFIRTGDRGIILGEERFLFVTGRCADVIRLPGDKAEVHPHYLETAAYEAFPRILRGGCMAAFEDSGKVTLVAEVLQKNKGEKAELGRVCEGIREAIQRRENVNVGKVVLVTSGDVPKTTSGKIMRWAAKDKVIRGGMRIISEMDFGMVGNSTMVNKDESGTSSNSNNRKTSIASEDLTAAYSFSGHGNTSRRTLISLL